MQLFYARTLVSPSNFLSSHKTIKLTTKSHVIRHWQKDFILYITKHFYKLLVFRIALEEKGLKFLRRQLLGMKYLLVFNLGKKSFSCPFNGNNSSPKMRIFIKLNVPLTEGHRFRITRAKNYLNLPSKQQINFQFKIINKMNCSWNRESFDDVITMMGVLSRKKENSKGIFFVIY